MMLDEWVFTNTLENHSTNYNPELSMIQIRCCCTYDGRGRRVLL
jgi:hypothetical protein